jgi:hypothetical protein
MSTTTTPTPAQAALATQLEADAALFSKIGAQLGGLIAAPFSLTSLLTIVALAPEVIQAIADIKATVADFKAAA